MAWADITPFPSLDELRKEHGRLLGAKEHGRLLGAKEAQKGDLAKEVIDFLGRTQRTGAILDFPADREAAQSVLDFWTATLFSLPNGVSAASTLPSVIPGVTEEAANLQLALFDPKTLHDAVKAADDWLARPGSDRTLARRILLRLVRLPPFGDKQGFESVPTVRAALADLDAPEKVNAAVAGLSSAGVIRVTPGETEEMDRLALRAPELKNEWPALKRWCDERLEFRRRVNRWKENGRPESELADGDALDEARQYHDRNGSEREYVNASAYLQARRLEQAVEDRRAKFLWRGLALAAAIGWIAAGVFLYFVIRQRDQVSSEKKSLSLKHQLTNLRLFVRALGELAAADTDPPTDPHKEIAVARWNSLWEQLKNKDDEQFKGLDLEALRIHAQSTDRRHKLTGREIDKIRSLRNPILEDEQLYQDSILPMREVAFGMVRLSSGKCAEILAAGKPFSEAAAYVKEFWTQYWGEMLLVEGEKVEAGMVQFGAALADIQTDLENPNPAAVTSEFTALSKQKQYTLDKANQLKSRISSLRLNAESFNQLAAELKVPKEDLNMVLRRSAERGVSNKDLLDKLKAKLQPLQEALDSECCVEIKPYVPSGR
jgi:hypothetical protein